MRQTPRSLARARGIGTLIGNGWLRESQPQVMPKWEVRGGKSALRKCMFMPVPEELRGLFPKVSSAVPQPQPIYRAARAQDMVPHRHDVRKDAREFPAYPAGGGGVVDPRVVAQKAHALHVQHAQQVAALAAAGIKPAGAAAWWEDPVALGSLLILVPPVGLAAVWSSKRYSSDARWALTVMTALTMCLMSAIIIAALAMG